MLLQIAAVIAPLFICAATGFLWARSRMPFNTDMIGSLVQNFALPCLIFSTLTKLNVSPAAFGEMAGAYLTALVIQAALGAVALRVAGLPMRAFIPAMTFSNMGNMGLPVCLFAFGEPGLALAIVIFVCNSILNFTVGINILTGNWSLRSVARNPLVWSLAVSFVFMVTKAVPPDWIANTVRVIGGFAVPAMLVALGVAVANLGVASLPRTVALSVVRQLVAFGAGFAMAWAFGLEGAARGVLILEMSMPVAVVNYLFAQRYGSEPGEVASMIVVTTAMAYAALPLILLVVW